MLLQIDCGTTSGLRSHKTPTLFRGSTRARPVCAAAANNAELGAFRKLAFYRAAVATNACSHRFLFCSGGREWRPVSVSWLVQGPRCRVLPVPVWDHAVRPDPRAAGGAAQVLPAHRAGVPHLRRELPSCCWACWACSAGLALKLCPEVDWSGWEKWDPGVSPQEQVILTTMAFGNKENNPVLSILQKCQQFYLNYCLQSQYSRCAVSLFQC